MKKTALLFMGFLLLLIVMATFAPWVTRHSYEEQSFTERLETPSTRHWFGTDSLGRDLYSRVVYGARTSLSVGFLTALIALFFGTLTGAIAGFRGGWIDHAIMSGVDLFYIFPSILLAIIVMMVVGQGIFGILIALGLTAWVNQARLVRAQVMQAKELPYVEAAHALGVSQFSILFKHILPNLWGPILVSLSFQIPTNIMAESFLSFIGLGIQPPYSSWGTLANDGFRAMKSYPHLILFPGAILFFTVLAFNYIGDALRDLWDPRSGNDRGDYQDRAGI